MQPAHHPGVPPVEEISHMHAAEVQQGGRGRPGGPSPGREMRRARIVITVQRTESYKRWLEENPLQAIIAGDGGDEEEAEQQSSVPPPRR